jgi:hypothetical protein
MPQWGAFITSFAGFSAFGLGFTMYHNNVVRPSPHTFFSCGTLAARLSLRPGLCRVRAGGPGRRGSANGCRELTRGARLAQIKLTSFIPSNIAGVILIGAVRAADIGQIAPLKRRLPSGRWPTGRAQALPIWPQIGQIGYEISGTLAGVPVDAPHPRLRPL